MDETYSTREAARAAGVTYRMLDHWLRTGSVRIADEQMPGSGHQRRFTSAEVETLIEIVALYRGATTVIDEFRSGQLWNMAYLGRMNVRDRVAAG